MPDLRTVADRITDGARGWLNPDNRAVFRSAVFTALTLGLSEDSVQAMFNNAAEAVSRDQEEEDHA